MDLSGGEGASGADTGQLGTPNVTGVCCSRPLRHRRVHERHPPEPTNAGVQPQDTGLCGAERLLRR